MEPGRRGPCCDISMLASSITAAWAGRLCRLQHRPRRRGRSTGRRRPSASTAPSAKTRLSRPRLARGRGGDQGLAVAVLDPGIAALERPVGMGELGDPPERVEPLARARRWAATSRPGPQARRRHGRARRGRGRAGRASARGSRSASSSSRCCCGASSASRSGQWRRQRLRAARRPARALRRAQRSARRPSSRTWPSSSLRTGTAISAAAVGVGARTSAAKSHSVVSVSWPTAEMIGIVRGGDGADHLLLVERPQILDRAAAARDDHQVGRGDRPAGRSASKPRTAAATCSAAPSPWTGTGQTHDMARAAVREPVEDVADHRAGRRGDDADHPRQERQRPLALGVEQALGGERPAALVEQRHQRALPGQLQPLDHDLVARAARIGGELAGRDHLDPVLGPEAQRAGAGRARSPRRCTRLASLRREIAMARGGALEAAKSRRARGHGRTRPRRVRFSAERQLGDGQRGRVVARRLGC